MRQITNIVLWKNLTDILGRSYDRREVQDQIDDLVTMFKTSDGKNRQILGELGHGTSSESVSLDRVSHYFENVRLVDFEDGACDLMADLTIMDTPCGQILLSLLEGGVKLRTSTRSTGYLDNMRVKKLKMTAIDIVTIGPQGEDAGEKPNVYLS